MSDLDRVSVHDGSLKATHRGELAANVASVLPRKASALMVDSVPGITAVKVRKKTDIIVAGYEHNSVYFNRDGWLFRYKILHNGCRQIMDFILPNQMFGLHACLFKESLYSVATITEATLSPIPFSMIDAAFEQNLPASKSVFWSAVSEAAILGEHLVDAGRRPAYERVSHLLLEIFVRLKGVGRPNRMSFHMPLTQELIGDALGLTAVHVNRTMRSLSKDKLIAIDGEVVTLCDFDGLCLISDFQNCYLAEAARPAFKQNGCVNIKQAFGTGTSRYGARFPHTPNVERFDPS